MMPLPISERQLKRLFSCGVGTLREKLDRLFFCRLFQSCGLAGVHVAVVEVLTAHGPDERVVLRGAGGVDAPLRGDHGLTVSHPDVAGLLRLTHKVADGLVVRNLEVEIDLHPAVVGVRRHRVPCAARLELGHTHLQLAGRHHRWYGVSCPHSLYRCRCGRFCAQGIESHRRGRLG